MKIYQTSKIGGPRYSLTPTCIRKFDSCRSNVQVILNVMVSSARNPVECAFDEHWKLDGG